MFIDLLFSTFRLSLHLLALWLHFCFVFWGPSIIFQGVPTSVFYDFFATVTSRHKLCATLKIVTFMPLSATKV